MKKNVIATWSGGKDSCFATYKAMQAGYDVRFLANTISQEYQRVRFHGLAKGVIQQQAEAVGIPLLQQATTAENYAEEFKMNLRKGLSSEIAGVVFGDIHLADCLTWANDICRDLGVVAIEPLWHKKQEDILREFIAAGFEAILVSTQANKLGKEWIGRKIDKAFVKDIAKLRDIDPSGENGEYHSLVLNGPIFRKKLQVMKAESVLRGGYWFLDIQKLI